MVDHDQVIEDADLPGADVLVGPFIDIDDPVFTELAAAPTAVEVSPGWWQPGAPATTTWRTNQTGAVASFQVTGTTRLGVRFNRAFYNRDQEEILPALYGFRVYEIVGGALTSLPSYAFAADQVADGPVVLANNLTSTKVYRCDIITNGITAAFRRNQGALAGINDYERWREVEDAPDSPVSIGLYGAFVEIQAIIGSSGITSQAVTRLNGKSLMDILIVGDSTSDGTIDQTSADDVGAYRTAFARATNVQAFNQIEGTHRGWTHQVARYVAETRLGREANICNASYGRYFFSTIRFPATFVGIGTDGKQSDDDGNGYSYLFSSVAAFRAGNVAPVNPAHPNSLPLPNYQGSLLDWDTDSGMWNRVTRVRTFPATFKPELVIMAMGLNDVGLVQAGSTWANNAIQDVRDLITNFWTLNSPRPRVLITSPWFPQGGVATEATVQGALLSGCVIEGWQPVSSSSTGELHYLQLQDATQSTAGQAVHSGNWPTHPDALEHDYLANFVLNGDTVQQGILSRWFPTTTSDSGANWPILSAGYN